MTKAVQMQHLNRKQKRRVSVLVDFAAWVWPMSYAGQSWINCLKEAFRRCLENHVKMDVDENPNTARAFEVMSIPALLFKKDGQVVQASRWCSHCREGTKSRRCCGIELKAKHSHPEAGVFSQKSPVLRLRTGLFFVFLFFCSRQFLATRAAKNTTYDWGKDENPLVEEAAPPARQQALSYEAGFTEGQ